MAYPVIVRRRRPRSRFELVHQPGPMTIEALAHAAGLMACADQRPEPAERAALLSFLRRRGLLLGRWQAILNEYDRSVRATAAWPLPELCRASRRLRRFAGSAGAALIADAAAHIAAADGINAPEEIVLMDTIREHLALGPEPQAGLLVQGQEGQLPPKRDNTANHN